MTLASRSSAPAKFALTMLLSFAAAAACGPPHRDVSAADVPTLTSLGELMDAQATTADPQMAKIDLSSFTDEDYAAFAETARRIEAMSVKAKDFSKGPAFDKLSDQLHENAASLAKAAAAKDAKGSSESLKEMKATCKECHAKVK